MRVINTTTVSDAICYRQDNAQAYGGYTVSWAKDGVVVYDQHDYGEWQEQANLPDTRGMTVADLEALGFYRYPTGDGDVIIAVEVGE